MLFWIIALALAAFSAWLLVAGLTRTSDPSGRTDMAIYRDQLAEVDRDLSKGVLNSADADRTRTEIARRLLAADKQAADVLTPGPVSVLMYGVPIMVVVATGAIYAALGGYLSDFQPQEAAPRAARIAAADAQLAARPNQTDAEAAWLAANPAPVVELSAEEQDLITRLRNVVADKPDALQGWIFLVDVELDLGNTGAAARAMGEVVRLKGDDATLADLERLLDLMVTATGGQITPEAELVLREILRQDPENGLGLYYAGLMRAIYGRPDLTFPIWRHVLDTSPADAPWVAPIRENILDMAWFAGNSDYELPATTGLRGPSQQDIANAADMSAEDQQAMIQSMVQSLGDRLASQGGTPDEWARLITALGVLKNTDRATAIWTEAQSVFATDDAALATIRAAAQQAGVTQ